MKYINTLSEGDRIRGIYFCKYRTSAVTKNGKEYGNLILQDKTGTLDGKIWNLSSDGVRDDFDSLDYVELTGDVVIFNGSPQLNVQSIGLAPEGTYDETDYTPASERDIEEMYQELLTYISKIENPYLSKLTRSFYVDDMDFVTRFKRHSAAKRVHHGFIGGLLEHTLGVVKVCDMIGTNYPFVNRDLLFTAALFHDIGKTIEISPFPENDYTDDGQLLGHIVMGCEIIGKAAAKIDGFPPVLESELKHCILAHHGEYEYGSPKKPAIVEAMALNFADEMDAKLQTFKEALSSPLGQSGEWMGFNRMFDSNIRKTSI